MQQRESVAILLINQVAEEIKLATLSFRRFFAGCRVDVVYTLEEALQWAHRAPWRLLLIDERLIEDHPASVLPELKRLVPSATLILQTDRNRPTSASDTLQAGADFLLDKQSPAFLTELVLYAKDTFEKQDVRTALEHLQGRHGRLTETLTDVLYELDSEGRFVYLSPSVANMLGYSPEELVGAPYSTVIAPDQLDQARYRFDDRRTGDRASRSVEIELTPKTRSERSATTRIKAELTAKGLYSAQHRHLGTIGLLHDISNREHQEETIHRLERQLQQTDQLLATAQQLVGLSKDLKAPQANLLTQSQQLLETIRDIRLIERLEGLALYAEEVARLGDGLTRIAVESNTRRETINDLIEAMLRTTDPTAISSGRIECAYASDLPLFIGNRDSTLQLLRILLSQALRYTTVVPNRHQLKISTAVFGRINGKLAPEVHIQIKETDTIVAGEGPLPQEADDLFEAYALLRQVGGQLDFHAPSGGPLSITIRVPTEPITQSSTVFEPTASIQSLRQAASEQTTAHPLISSPPLPDRRNSSRITVHCPVDVTIDNQTYPGTVTTLAQRGMDIQVNGWLPSLEKQPAYVLLKTDVGILELQATAHDRGFTLTQSSSDPDRSHFVLSFTALSTIEEQSLLASLLDKARAQTLSMTAETLLTSNETGVFPLRKMEEDDHDTEHRETLRVRVKLPVRVEILSPDTRAQHPHGLVINLSRSGACLHLEELLGNVGDRVVLHFPATSPLGRRTMHKPLKSEEVLAADIVWTTATHGAAEPATKKTDRRLGIRFAPLTPFIEPEISQVVAQHIIPSINFDRITGRSSMTSAAWECRNPSDQMITVTDCHARHDLSSNMPIMILAPGYGRTQTDYLQLASYLAANGFRALRYDHTNHVGQSDGDIRDTTLSSMQTDLQSILLFARTTWPTADINILAEDVAARVALKIMAESWPADRLFLLNPILDLKSTLFNTYQQDMVTDNPHRSRRGITNLWGFNVNLDQFISDAITGEYIDLQTSEADLAALPTPPTIFTSPDRLTLSNPLGISLESLRTLAKPPIVVPLSSEVSGESTLHTLHQTHAFHIMVEQLSSDSKKDLSLGLMNHPTLRDFRQRRQAEHEQIRIQHHVSQARRDALWKDHLAQLPYLADLPAYRTMQDELYRSLLPLAPGMTILDIGPGQGDFTNFLLTNRAYWSVHSGKPIAEPIRYIGLGRSQEELSISQQHLHAHDHGSDPSVSPLLSAQQVEVTWMAYDWETPLPFRDQSVERILSNLFLPFISSPLHGLKEAMRVLRPGGTMVATCFQPHTDLSTLFHQYARTTEQNEFEAPAQKVLHYLGCMREAIRHGLLHNYERNELANLFIHVGAQPLRILPIFDNHLLLAIVQKTKLSG